MTNSNVKLLSAIVAAIALAYTPVSLVAPAHAYDDDVEFICGENDDGTDWCVSVEDLKAECPLSDPEYTSDECQGLLEDNRRPTRSDWFKVATGQQTPDTRDNDTREPQSTNKPGR